VLSPGNSASCGISAWVEGQNIAFERRYAEDQFDRLTDLAIASRCLPYGYRNHRRSCESCSPRDLACDAIAAEEPAPGDKMTSAWCCPATRAEVLVARAIREEKIIGALLSQGTAARSSGLWCR
jgi:hypothetical protein